MIKKFLKIACALIASIFLVIGISYSSFSVIPFVKYYEYDTYSGTPKKSEYGTYYIFNFNGAYEYYSKYLSEYELQGLGLAKEYNSRFYVFDDDGISDYYKVSFDKRSLTEIRSNKLLKASWNPTFIFYIISSVAIFVEIVLFKNEIKILTQKIKQKLNKKDGE